jgi:hypothetical protein
MKTLVLFSRPFTFPRSALHDALQAALHDGALHTASEETTKWRCNGKSSEDFQKKKDPKRKQKEYQN